MRCPPRLKRCFAHMVVTGLVALLLCWVAYLQEPPSSSETSALSRPPPPVVAIVHQSWSDRNLPPLFASWSATFGDCFPGYRRVLWTDADNRELIALHYPWFLARYDSLAPGVQRADVSRLFYMHRHGGLYCDLDCECLRGFEHLLANTSLALGAMSGSLIEGRDDPAFVEEGQVENSFMYSRPGHPFFWDLILRLNATSGELPIMTTGPYLIMSGINAARKVGLDRTRFDGLPYLTVYPPRLFNPFSWIKVNSSPIPGCQLFGKFTAELLAKCRDAFKNGSYLVQYHTQVWDKGRHNVLKGRISGLSWLENCVRWLLACFD